MKSKYIQLPPLPSDVPPILVQMLWLYVKMSGQEQESLLNFMKENLKVDDENLNETKFLEMLNDDTAEINPDVIEYTNLMRRMIGGMIVQACEMASLVYQSHCVEGKSVEDIAKEYEMEEEFLQLVAEYYDNKEKLMG